LIRTARESRQSVCSSRTPERSAPSPAQIYPDPPPRFDRAVLDDEGAVHVGFAERELGVDENPAFGVGRQEPYADRLARSIAAGKSCSARGRECHRTAANELA